MKQLLTPISVLLAGGLIAGAVFITQGEGEGGDRQTATVATPGLEESLLIHDWDQTDGSAAGDPNAPVTIVEYSDFACPFCTRHWQETLPRIKSEFIDQGLVYYVYKDFPVVGGARAAEAARCAEDQGAFWEYHDVLFSRHAEDRQQWNQSEVHREYAEVLGLDADELVECFNDRRHQETTLSMAEEAQNAGGQGTPFFLVNDTPIAGAQPFQVFEEAINAEL